MNFLSRNDFYPEVLFYDKATRSYISKFLVNYLILTPEQTHNDTIISMMANRLAQLHKLSSDEIHHTYNPQQITESVIIYLKKYNKFPTQFINKLTVLCHRVNELLKRTGANDDVFCHGDMTPYNIMYKESQEADIQFTDWEMSATTIDIGIWQTSVECGFNDSEDFAFLASYFGYSPTDIALLKLYLTKLQVQYFLAGWAMLQMHLASSYDHKLDIFKHFYKTRIDNCKKILSSDRYRTCIEYLNKPEGPLTFPIGIYHLENSKPNQLTEDIDSEDKQSTLTSLRSISIFKPTPKVEQTLVILKPDLLMRDNDNTEEAIQFLKTGLIVARKSLVMTQQQIEALYPKINPDNQKIYYDVLDLMTLHQL